VVEQALLERARAGEERKIQAISRFQLDHLYPRFGLAASPDI